MPGTEPAGVKLAAPDRRRFDGIRVVPDIHGSFDGLAAALDQAGRDRMFVVQLGDLIDRGDCSPLCALAMMEACAAGCATLISGFCHRSPSTGAVKNVFVKAPCVFLML
jgi:hypothetical protein